MTSQTDRDVTGPPTPDVLKRSRPGRVVIVGGGGAESSAFAERLASCWPEPGVLPDLERWSVAELDAGLLASERGGGVLGDAGIVVLVEAAAGGTDRHVVHIADAIERHSAPAVFVAATETAAARCSRAAMLHRRGMTSVWGEDAAEQAAVALHGMALRQPFVQRLAAEARVTHRALSGARDELDRIEGELREAARVQQNFAHRDLPEIPGLGLAAVYRPASHVSGDVFDVEVLDERHVGIFLADAAGHGVPAAMLTLFISRALPKTERSGGTMRIIPPGEALARLNHDFASRGGPTDRFATAVYAVYDAETRWLTVAGAGHPAPILTSPDAEAERIETDGPLLGVFPDATFAETTVALSEGRSAVLFSDGWEVAFPKADADAHDLRVPTRTYLDRLTQLGAACARRGSCEAIDEITRLLDGQAGSLHQPDDVTALVLTGEPMPASVAA